MAKKSNLLAAISCCGGLCWLTYYRSRMLNLCFCVLSNNVHGILYYAG